MIYTIPSNSATKHPSYPFAHLMKAKNIPSQKSTEDLYAKYQHLDDVHRMSPFYFDNGVAVSNIICIDIENKSELIDASSMYGAILREHKDLLQYAYIESTLSGGYHIFLSRALSVEDSSIALAYDKNNILLIELLGNNSLGVTVGLGSGGKYKPLANTVPTNLSKNVPDDLYYSMLYTIAEFNSKTTIDKVEISIERDGFQDVKNTYAVNPLTEYNKNKDIALGEINALLMEHGYIRTWEEEKDEHLIIHYKHDKSDKKQTLSVHTHYNTLYSLSTSDTNFTAKIPYRYSDILALLKFEGNYVATAKYIHKEYELGLYSGVPASYRFYEVITNAKTMEVTAKLSRSKLKKFLLYLGYRTLRTPSDKNEIVRVTGNIVKRNVQMSDIHSVVYNALSIEYNTPAYANHLEAIENVLIADKTAFNLKSFFNGLDPLAYSKDSSEAVMVGGYNIIDRMQSTPLVSYHFYRDCYLEIKADKSMSGVVRTYDNCGYYILENEIVDFNYFPKGHEVIDGDKIEFDIREFRGFNFLYFMFDVMDNDHRRFTQLASAMGFMLYAYKDASVSKAVVLLDAQDTKNNAIIGRKAGRTGKSLMMNFLRETSAVDVVVPVDGVQLRDNNQFSFGNIKPTTQIVTIDDLNNKYAMTNLYTSITGYMRTEAKGVQSVEIPFDDSPKLIISSNYMIIDNSPSTANRTFQVYFSNTFNENYTPIDKYGERFFGKRDPKWTEVKQRLLHHLAMYCVATYHRVGVVRYDTELQNKRLLNSFVYTGLDTTIRGAIKKNFEQEFLNPDTDRSYTLSEGKYILSEHGVKVNKDKLIADYKANHPSESFEFKSIRMILSRMLERIEGLGMEMSMDNKGDIYLNNIEQTIIEGV